MGDACGRRGAERLPERDDAEAGCGHCGERGHQGQRPHGVTAAESRLEAEKAAERAESRQHRPARKNAAHPVDVERHRVGLDGGVGGAVEHAGGDRLRDASGHGCEHGSARHREYCGSDQDARV